MVYSVEKMLKEQGRQEFPAPTAAMSKTRLQTPRKALESERQSEMDKARETLTQPRTSWPSKCTNGAASGVERPRGAGLLETALAGGNGQGKDEGVIDAEF